MKPIKYRPLSVGDLHEIWSFTEEKWNRPQADSYVAGLLDEIGRLGADPKLGTQVSYIPGLKRLRYKSHFVLFLEFDDHIEVRRVLHVRMNIPKRLRDQ